MVVGIIGAGASGMAAALAASENSDTMVVLMERQARVGRKLLSTGNGRCNLTNLHAMESGYHGEDPFFSQYARQQYSPEATLEWFRGMGLFTVAEASGRVYPYSASTLRTLSASKPVFSCILGFSNAKRSTSTTELA